MNRILVLPLVITLALTACSATPYRITNQSVVASTPERMVVVSLRKSKTATKIIVLADNNKTFVTFRDQLEITKAITAELDFLKSFRVCGKSIRLAEFQLIGDTSLMKEVTVSSGTIIQFLGVPSSETQCASEILTWNPREKL